MGDDGDDGDEYDDNEHDEYYDAGNYVEVVPPNEDLRCILYGQNMRCWSIREKSISGSTDYQQTGTKNNKQQQFPSLGA